MFFAPKFDGFGRDVARAVAHQCNGGRVHGLCAGPRDVFNRVSTELKALGGRCWQLQEGEAAWVKREASAKELEHIEEILGAGAFGRIITADRAFGRGFVRGGLLRPTHRAGRMAFRDTVKAAQRYINGLVYFLDDVLRETEPDVVFSYAVASAPAVALAELCKMRNIPFCRLTHTRIGNRYTVDDDAAGRLARVARRFERARDGRKPFMQPSIETARRQLATFRTNPSEPGYVRHATTSSLLRELIYMPVHCLKEISRGRWPGLDVARLSFKVWIAWRRIFAGRRWFSPSDDLPSSFVYFPLHVDPEASTMVLSPWHTDQLAVIEALAKAVPTQMQLVVKEHAPMLGRRPRGFYRQIAKMPRVTLLGPNHSTFELIKRAHVTAVITGTAAWEAIQLGKRALIVGDSPFLPIAEGIVHEQDLSRIHLAIRSLLSSPPASDRTLSLYIAAMLAESFDMPSTLLWGNYHTHSSELRNAGAIAIADEIVRLMDEPIDC